MPLTQAPSRPQPPGARPDLGVGFPRAHDLASPEMRDLSFLHARLSAPFEIKRVRFEIAIAAQHSSANM